MKKKKYPFWYEAFDGLDKMNENLQRVFTGLPFRIPKVKVEFPRNIPVDMEELDKDLILRAELPGFSKDEVKLKVTPTTIDISAEKKKVSVEKRENF